MSEGVWRLKVGDYMTEMPHSIEPNQGLDAAWRLMGKLRVRHLPVLAGGRVVGLLSERDVTYLRQLVGDKDRHLRVRDAMVDEPVWVNRDDSLQDVARRMAQDHIGSVLVCDEQRHLLGIFTTSDALEVLAKLDELEPGLALKAKTDTQAAIGS